VKLPFVTEVIKRLASQIGATVLIEPEYGFVGQITFKNSKRTFFRNGKFEINNHASVAIVQDKGYASFFLKELGYKMPEEQTFFSEKLCSKLIKNRNIDDGYAFAKKLGFPAIVKPNDLTKGILVAKVYNQEEYYQIAQQIFLKTSVLLIQKFYPGNDYRVVVLDGEIASAYQRMPLSVIGNGKSSIFEILHQKKTLFLQESRDITIDLDDFRIAANLHRQGLNLNSVIPENTRIKVLDNANLSTGGEAIDVTKEIHPDFQKLAISVTKDIGLRLGGVDIITSDITQPMQDYVIIEINGAPGLEHYASIGEQQMKVVEELYLKIIKAIEMGNG
jgi:D-alanine-D-alanine ligase-like ATP-grasp enzyme